LAGGKMYILHIYLKTLTFYGYAETTTISPKPKQNKESQTKDD